MRRQTSKFGHERKQGNDDLFVYLRSPMPKFTVLDNANNISFENKTESSSCQGSLHRKGLLNFVGINRGNGLGFVKSR